MEHETCPLTDNELCRAGLCPQSEFAQSIMYEKSTLSAEELKHLKNIIIALQDVYDSAKSGKRHREFAVVDIIEEQLSILELIRKL